MISVRMAKKLVPLEKIIVEKYIFCEMEIDDVALHMSVSTYMHFCMNIRNFIHIKLHHLKFLLNGRIGML